MANEDSGGRSASPRRAVLSTAGWVAGRAAHRTRGIISREPKTLGSEDLASDSFHRPTSGSAVAGPYADTAPVPEQTAAMDL